VIKHRSLPIGTDNAPAGHIGVSMWPDDHFHPWGLILAASECATAGTSLVVPAVDSTFAGNFNGTKVLFTHLVRVALVVNVRTAGPLGSYLRVAAAFWADTPPGGAEPEYIADSSIEQYGWNVAGLNYGPRVPLNVVGLFRAEVLVQSRLRTFSEADPPADSWDRQPVIHLRIGGGNGVASVNIGSAFVYAK
jgi:hypothetical protein